MKENGLLQVSDLDNIELEITELQKTKLQNQIEKKELIDRFFSIGSNMHKEKLFELEKDLERFIAKTNDKDIKRLLIVFEMFKIDLCSKEIYTLSDDFYELFMELCKKDDMTFFEIRILLIMFVATDEPREVFNAVNHLLENVDNYMREPDYIRVRFSIYQNAIDILMYLRRTHDNYRKNEHDKKLIEYLVNATPLAKQYGNKYWSSALRLKFGILLQDNVIIDCSINTLKSFNDSIIDRHISSLLGDYNMEY